MIGISGFKTQKPRQFNYTPRSYDPEQEERDQRKAARDPKATSENYKPGSLVRNMRMSRYMPNTENSKFQENEARTRKRLRLFIFLFFLVIIGILVMNSTLLENVFAVFMG